MNKNKKDELIQIGDEVKFYYNGQYMNGKVEDMPSNGDKVRVFASPISSPTTLRSYRVELFNLKLA